MTDMTVAQRGETLPAPREYAPVSDTSALIQAISDAARDPAVDVGKMERLFAMRKELAAEQAEIAFNAAMSGVQEKMRRVTTDKRNAQTGSDYATYGQLDRALRPLYTEGGFALSFTTEPSGASMVRVVCFVSHAAGHTRRYEIDMPADGKGAKGNDVMTRTHATGSAATYGMRYLLKMIFNVAIGKDDDGNGANRTARPSAEEAKTARWLEAAGKIEDMPQYQQQLAKLKKEYGNKNANIPREVKAAFTAAKAKVEPKDEA